MLLLKIFPISDVGQIGDASLSRFVRVFAKLQKVLNKRVNARKRIEGSVRSDDLSSRRVSSLLVYVTVGCEAKPERTIILSIYLSCAAFKRKENNDAARETFGNLLRREEDGEGWRKHETE